MRSHGDQFREVARESAPRQVVANRSAAPAAAHSAKDEIVSFGLEGELVDDNANAQETGSDVPAAAAALDVFGLSSETKGLSETVQSSVFGLEWETSGKKVPASVSGEGSNAQELHVKRSSNSLMTAHQQASRDVSAGKGNLPQAATEFLKEPVSPSSEVASPSLSDW